MNDLTGCSCLWQNFRLERMREVVVKRFRNTVLTCFTRTKRGNHAVLVGNVKAEESACVRRGSKCDDIVVIIDSR